MYVGENDEYRWHDEMKQEAEFLRSKGTVARYSVEKGQPHRLETLAGLNAARLFDGFEETLTLEHLRLLQSPFATHITYRVVR